ncbi:aldose 1-epimerase-like [Mizuhopecten yessoensis]|uniref:Aldose 1-epimerase n=1 Tax=Mizuhopecten yessoensis TaxID=6573 RepID=A0A210R3C1_MIZYE|nr:aldose 1-epimerase-like [Mizuhopecten yessoensis]OWF55426.1 Aldose 1-epimerase [Mizuhopecten yessoensis]
MSVATITQDNFGKTKDGQDVNRFTFTNKNNVTVRVLDYGCIITEILVPDKNGEVKDVNLGFDGMEGYLTRSPYFGAVCGRVANRIAGGKFSLDGQEFQLPVNNGLNCLHGGVKGFDKVIWDTTVDGDRLFLRYVSADNEEGFPGEVTTTVSYRLSDDNVFSIEYTATTTKATPINLTNHSYFNLAGQGTQNLDGHVIQLLGDHYTPLNENIIPTGEVAPVMGTPMDLRKPVSVPERMKEVNGGLGFDHNFCVGEGAKLKFVARVEHVPSGRVMDVSTTEPGLQCYTSKNLKPTLGKGGVTYQKFSAICLEAQHYPDSVNHSNFPDTILRPGEVYQQTTTYKFGLAE